MIKAYKYRIYPNKSQQDFFNKSFGCCRYIYNWALNLKIETYQQTKESLSSNDLCKLLTLHKKEEGKEWLKEVSNISLQQSIRNLDLAYTKFFREKKGFPKFKSKHKSRLSCKFTKDFCFDFKNEKIELPKIGFVNFVCHRTFSGKVGTLTVSKTPTDKYFASVVVDDLKQTPTKHEIKSETTVGIDVGIKNLAVLSNGEIVKNMKFLENNEKRLKVLQRRLSKKKIGSNRRNVAKLKLAKQYEKITNLRHDYLHKISSKIISENQSVVIEDLNIEGMLKNHHLAKSISSVAWNEFFNMLQYKAEWSGVNFIKIGRFEPSSKMCSCGKINRDLKLSDRTWTCNCCGLTHDRDLLAANNIKRFGLAKQNLIGISPAVCRIEDVELSELSETVKRQHTLV